jgi:hypothetical protein
MTKDENRVKELEGLGKAVEGVIAHAMAIDAFPHIRKLIDVYGCVVEDIIEQRKKVEAEARST